MPLSTPELHRVKSVNTLAERPHRSRIKACTASSGAYSQIELGLYVVIVFVIFTYLSFFLSVSPEIIYLVVINRSTFQLDAMRTKTVKHIII